MHTCNDPIVNLSPPKVMQLEVRDYSCGLWQMLSGELYMMTVTDSAASVQPRRFMTASFGVFAIEEIEAS